jgi:hypothetical protein
MNFTTVELHPTRASAEVAKRAIDSLACGNRCTRNHFVTDLAFSALEEW